MDHAALIRFPQRINSPGRMVPAIFADSSNLPLFRMSSERGQHICNTIDRRIDARGEERSDQPSASSSVTSPASAAAKIPMPKPPGARLARLQLSATRWVTTGAAIAIASSVSQFRTKCVERQRAIRKETFPPIDLHTDLWQSPPIPRRALNKMSASP